MSYRTKVLGTGSYLPEKIMSNYDLEKLMETAHDWIVERTGIHRRHYAAEGQVTSDLCVEASKIALKEAGLTPHDIDFIIVGTVSPDHIMPNTACMIQEKLGCRNVGCMDLSTACTGFVYALTVADQFIRSGMYKNILVVGAEILSRLMNFNDRTTSILFGDAAGAFVVGRAEENEKNIILSSHLHAEGKHGDLFMLLAGGSKVPITHEAIERGDHQLKMKGKEIFKVAVRTMSECCHEALNYNGLSKSDVDWVVPHQANLRIIEAVAKHFEIPMEKVIVTVHETGNTSAATVPVAFDMAAKQGKIKRGDTVLMTAFGAGLTSGSLLLRY